MKYFLIAVCVGVLGCVHSASKRKPADDGAIKPRHLIVLVHGIGGNRNTFGDMESVLPHYLESIDLRFRPIIKSFEYRNIDTDEMGTFEYSSKLGEFIEQQFAAEPLTAEDKISIIAHSQGGLVSIIWYVENMLTLIEKPYEKYANQVDSIITLGTPFWGSKLAAAKYYQNSSEDDKFSALPWLEKTLDLFSKKVSKKGVSAHELKDMGFLSDVIYRFRQVAIKVDQAGYRFKARPLNIAGVIPTLSSDLLAEAKARGFKSAIGEKILAKTLWVWPRTGFGYERYEGDQAVLIPSSRVDFIYGVDHDSNYSASSTFGFDNFKESKFKGVEGNVPFVPTVTVHASVDPKAFYDMADVPRACLVPINCKHPTFRYLVAHLLHCTREAKCDAGKYNELIGPLFGDAKTLESTSPHDLLQGLRGFTIDINLELPRQYEVPLSYRGRAGFDRAISFDRVKPYNKSLGTAIWNAIQGKEDPQDGELISAAAGQDFKIYVGRSREYLSAVGLHSRMANNDAEVVQHLRYFLTGIVVPDIKFKSSHEERAWLDKYKDGFPIKFRVNLPGLKTRNVVAKIKPTYSTYVDLHMAPYKN